MRPITLLICALGGEGGGRLTQWIVEAARLAGHPAQATSVPGVAQRTGSTTYYVEVWPEHESTLGGRWPVFSLSPVPGALDGLLASELLEAARAAALGLPSAERTLVLGSTSRTLTTIERMQLGDGRLDNARLAQLLAATSREQQLFDMGAMARECGTALSAVMLGALAGSGLLPFTRAHFEAAVRADAEGAGTAATLRGLAQAFEHVQAARERTAYVGAVLQPPDAATQAGAPAASPLPEAWLGRLPRAAHEMAALGVARLIDYQGPAYVELYLQRLARVAQADGHAGPGPEHGPSDAAAGEATAETARWLALWMAFDDIVRVADLKSRASRRARVAREVQAGRDDVLKVWEHFKPGVAEFAGLLPAWLARPLLAWEARRVARGREPWALPIRLPTHTVHGLLALRALAACRRLRPRGSRYAQEQAMIERWLAGVCAGLQRDAHLGLEVARCGRLVKGYGSTNERGKENLLHVLVHLSQGADAAAAAEAVRAAREAALADDSGRALDEALLTRGAPPRPVKPQPIRWMRRPGFAASGAAQPSGPPGRT